MGWFKMAVFVWLTFALIRYIGVTLIDAEWGSSNGISSLLRTTWGFNVVIKSVIGTLYQAAVITMFLSMIQHCFHLVMTNRQDIFIIAVCTAVFPLLIPYIIYGGVTLDQYIIGLDECFGFVLIALLFYAIADFFETLQIQQPVDHGSGPTTGNVRPRGSGDRVSTTRVVSPRTSPTNTTNQSPLPHPELERAVKLRAFTFYTFLFSLPLVILWEW